MSSVPLSVRFNGMCGSLLLGRMPSEAAIVARAQGRKRTHRRARRVRRSKSVEPPRSTSTTRKQKVGIAMVSLRSFLRDLCALCGQRLLIARFSRRAQNGRLDFALVSLWTGFLGVLCDLGGSISGRVTCTRFFFGNISTIFLRFAFYSL